MNKDYAYQWIGAVLVAIVVVLVAKQAGMTNWRAAEIFVLTVVGLQMMGGSFG